jgi:hypothetical protein
MLRDDDLLFLTKRELEDLIDAGIKHHYDKTTYNSVWGQRRSLKEDIMEYMDIHVEIDRERSRSLNEALKQLLTISTKEATNG